jgi:hypothetical protein
MQKRNPWYDRPKTKLEFVCEHCGAKFYREKSDCHGKFKKRFCCKNCANKANAQKNSISKMGEKNPLYGKKPWNKGVFGVVKHPEHSGEKNHFWRGGISREKYRLRRSGEWKRWRLEVFVRDRYICRRCGKVGGQLVPHHIKLFSYFPELRFEAENGVTICVKCHKILHRKENQIKKIINIYD